MKIKAKWLRKCPFCGSRDVETKTSYEVAQRGLTMLLCFGCGATVSFQGKEQKHLAIAAWNRRAEEQPREAPL